MKSCETEDGLDLEVFLEAEQPVFAAVAGPFVAAERGMGVPRRGVDVDLARADAQGDAAGLREIGTVDVTAKAVFGVVGNRNGLVDVIIGNDDQHRPEDFLLRDAH